MNEETINENITDPSLLDDTAFFKLTDTPEAKERRELHRQEDDKREYYRAIVEKANSNVGGFTNQTGSENLTNSQSIASYQKTAEKSKGKDKKTKTSHKVPVQSIEVKVIDTTKITRKIAIILSALTIVTALGTIVDVVEGDNIRKNIEIRQITKQNASILKSRAMLNLLVNNLAEIDPATKEITIKNNNTKDYWKLGITNKYDIYAYYKILPTQEFYKFIQTVTYQEGIAYIDINQFLTYNGYIDPKDNKYKMTVFENIMEAKIAEIPRDIIERYQEDPSILTYDDLMDIISSETNSPPGKGGK